MRPLVLGVVVMTALSGGCLSAYAQTPSDAPLVGVAPAQVRDVAPSTEFVGRVEAINAVDILSRVTGLLKSRLFNEGDIVREGQELFTIERESYEIALAEADAALAGARAMQLDAERQLHRSRTLVGRQAAAQATLDQAETALDSARATVMSAEARVRQARLNLGYTAITSPFDGRIGVSAFSEGGFIGPSSGTLARVVQTDPIRVVFSVSDRTILDLRQAAGGLTKEELAGRFTIGLRLSNGEAYDQSGTIEFFNNEIDPQTGTLAIRAQFANSRSILVPGQFVTVAVRETAPELRVVVPFGAVQQDREGKFVFTVGEGDRVEMKRIKVSDQSEGDWIVEEGLKEGDRVIVEGLQNAASGAVVNATEVDPQAMLGASNLERPSGMVR